MMSAGGTRHAEQPAGGDPVAVGGWMRTESWRSLILILLLSAGTGCAKPVPQEARTSEPSFEDRVWTVAESDNVAKGTLYVFLSEGTLVIASPRGKPMLGSWRHDGERLVMVEDSIAYATDILHLDEKEFRIRSNNPGSPVEIRLVRADSSPAL
jgi:hypothetical protein